MSEEYEGKRVPDDHQPDRLPGAGADGEDLNMSVEPKSELELLREQAQACRNLLLAMGSPDGQPGKIRTGRMPGKIRSGRAPGQKRAAAAQEETQLFGAAGI